MCPAERQTVSHAISLESVRMVGLFHLRTVLRTMVNRGVFQGNQADASAGGFPRNQRERH